jgi:hypothetical protein
MQVSIHKCRAAAGLLPDLWICVLVPWE